MNQLNKIKVSYFLVIILWVVSITAKFKFNGLMFGFDYGLFQPDGYFYSYHSLILLGQDHDSAAIEVSQWYRSQSAKPWGLHRPGNLPETSPLWGLVAPRVLYPIVSMPFVAIFGLKGMLAIPALSLLTLAMSVQYLSSKFNKPALGLLINLVLLNSITVLRWMLANVTDSLFCALFALVLILLLKRETEKNALSAPLIIFLVLLSVLTRFAVPIWFAISIILYLRKDKVLAISTTLSALVFSIPTFVLSPTNAFLPSAGNISIFEKFLEVPKTVVAVPGIEFLQLLALDRILLFLLLFSSFLALRNRDSISAQYFIAVFLAVISIGVLNGTLGVNFRYQLPLLPFSAWVIIENFNFKVFGRKNV